MLKNCKRIKKKRTFSEDFRKKVVQEYESGEHSVRDMEKIYRLSSSLIYSWIYRYSTYNKKSVQVVEIKDSQMERLKRMEARIKELERAVGQKQMNIDYLEKMIELAKEHYDIDIKKNLNTPQSGGSKNIKKS